MDVTIKNYSRLHLSLIGMGNAGYRINGGIGFALNDPSLEVSCSLSDTPGIILKDKREAPLESVQIQQLEALLTAFLVEQQITDGVSFSVTGSMPTHSGFGSSTAIRLASLETLSTLFELTLSRHELVTASERGGASGVGINTYFDGGFVLDVRHPATGTDLAPSHAKKGHLPALALAQCPMPEWPIGICIPKSIPLKTQLEEQHFFRNHCPLAISAIHEILYHCVYGVTAAVITQDFERFCEAIRTLQHSAWKNGERSLYGESLQEIENVIYDEGATAVGMSSLGPGLFFFGNDLSKTITSLKEARPDCDWILTSPRNTGREIEK